MEKKETMMVDEEPFSPVAIVDVINIDLRVLINEMRINTMRNKQVKPKGGIRKC